VAYPVIPDVYRCQVALHGASGLPEDVYVNNWYGAMTDGRTQDDATLWQDMYTTFLSVYTVVPTIASATQTIAGFMPNSVTHISMKIYNIGAASPRYPVETFDQTTLTTSGTTAMPGEVALCGSFAGGNGPRKKGRVFFGPFHQGANRNTAEGGRPDQGLQASIIGALIDLAQGENAQYGISEWRWAQVSPTAATYDPVVRVWCDDAWDTIRSRGLSPVSRLTANEGDGWVLAGP